MISAKLDIPVVTTVGVEINIADCDAEVATLIKNRLESVIPQITKPIVVGEADVALTDATAPEQPVTAETQQGVAPEPPAKPARKRGRPNKSEPTDKAEASEPATESSTEPAQAEQPEIEHPEQPEAAPEPAKELLDYDPECCVNAQALAEGPGSGCRECNGCGRFDEDKPSEPEPVAEIAKPGLFDTLKPGDWIRVNSDRGKPYRINSISNAEQSVSLAERGTVFADDINESWVLAEAPHDYFPGDMIRHNSDVPKSAATLPDAATITKVSEKVILTNHGEMLRSVVDAEYDVLSDAEAFGIAHKTRTDAPESPATDLDAMFAAATEPNDDEGEPVAAASDPRDFLT